MQLIIKDYFNDHQSAQSHFLCNIVAAPQWLSFHCCSYSTFIGWCPYGPWV